MKKRVILSTLIVLMIISQLTGCAGVTKQEAENMLNQNDQIEIEIADQTDNTQVQLYRAEWTELGSLTTYPEFRAKIDEIFGTARNEFGTSGCIYVDPNGTITNNSTLKYALANKTFLTILTEHETSMQKYTEATAELYPDLVEDKIAINVLYAMLDAYFGIFNDGTATEFNGNQTLTRAEFLTGVYKADTPVHTLVGDADINYDELSPFVNQMLKYSYLGLTDGSMSENTYNGTMTRAEAVYTIVKMYYNTELIAISNDYDAGFTDAKNGGYNTDATINKATELNNALKNPDGGVPADLYKALAIAESNEIITSGETRWDEGITKAEALELIMKTYISLGTTENETPDNTEVIMQEEINPATQQIFIGTDGKIGYTREAFNIFKEAVAQAGIGTGFTGKIINDYYEAMEGRDMSEIDTDLVNSLVSDFARILEAQEEQDKLQQQQQQQAQEEQNNSSGNNNSSAENENVPVDGGGSPIGWDQGQDDDSSGGTSIDLDANDAAAGDGGEILDPDKPINWNN